MPYAAPVCTLFDESGKKCCELQARDAVTAVIRKAVAVAVAPRFYPFEEREFLLAFGTDDRSTHDAGRRRFAAGFARTVQVGRVRTVTLGIVPLCAAEDAVGTAVNERHTLRFTRTRESVRKNAVHPHHFFPRNTAARAPGEAPFDDADEMMRVNGV